MALNLLSCFCYLLRSKVYANHIQFKTMFLTNIDFDSSIFFFSLGIITSSVLRQIHNIAQALRFSFLSQLNPSGPELTGCMPGLSPSALLRLCLGNLGHCVY